MDEYILLTEEQRREYEPMIPQWILHLEKEYVDVDFWGMRSFGSPGGVAVLSEEGKEMKLLYLYLTEEYRHTGRGSAFLQELINHAYERGCQSFVVSYIPGVYQDFEELLLQYDFHREDEKTASFSCSLQELLMIPQLQGSFKSVKSLPACSEQSLHSLYRTMMEAGEDYVDLPLRKQEYLGKCCAVAMEENQPAGLLLVKTVSEKEITIPLMVNYSHNVMAVMDMMRFALQQAQKLLPSDTSCHFDVVNESLVLLLEKLGIPITAKRQRCTLDLSYLKEIEEEVKKEIFEKLLTTDYIFEGTEEFR